MPNLITPAADLAFVNGKIVTVNVKDEVTEALAVRGRKILRVGPRECVDPTIGPDTKSYRSPRPIAIAWIHREPYPYD